MIEFAVRVEPSEAWAAGGTTYCEMSVAFIRLT